MTATPDSGDAAAAKAILISADGAVRYGQLRCRQQVNVEVAGRNRALATARGHHLAILGRAEAARAGGRFIEHERAVA